MTFLRVSPFPGYSLGAGSQSSWWVRPGVRSGIPGGLKGLLWGFLIFFFSCAGGWVGDISPGPRASGRLFAVLKGWIRSLGGSDKPNCMLDPRLSR
jgi:hypothetical protein